MIERTTDIDKINSVLKHPYIWPRVAGDHPIEGYTPPMEGNHYLYDEGVLFILHDHGENLRIHANVLPEYRHKAEKAAKEALKYGFNVLKADKITAKIPKTFSSVYGFALKFMNDVGMVGNDHQLELGRKEWAL
jgi:hypothetical protein